MGDLDEPNTGLLKTVYSRLRRQQYSGFSPSDRQHRKLQVSLPPDRRAIREPEPTRSDHEAGIRMCSLDASGRFERWAER